MVQCSPLSKAFSWSTDAKYGGKFYSLVFSIQRVQIVCRTLASYKAPPPVCSISWYALNLSYISLAWFKWLCKVVKWGILGENFSILRNVRFHILQLSLNFAFLFIVLFKSCEKMLSVMFHLQKVLGGEITSRLINFWVLYRIPSVAVQKPLPSREKNFVSRNLFFRNPVVLEKKTLCSWLYKELLVFCKIIIRLKEEKHSQNLPI